MTTSERVSLSVTCPGFDHDESLDTLERLKVNTHTRPATHVPDGSWIGFRKSGNRLQI